MGGRLRELVGPGSNWEGSCLSLNHGGLRALHDLFQRPSFIVGDISLAGRAARRDCHVVNLRALSGPSRLLFGWLVGEELLHLAGVGQLDEESKPSRRGWG